MKNIVFSTASLLGKASKLVVSLTGSTFSSIKDGYISGYTGINTVNDVNPAVEQPKEQTPTVSRTPVQQEFDFSDIRQRMGGFGPLFFIMFFIEEGMICPLCLRPKDNGTHLKSALDCLHPSFWEDQVEQSIICQECEAVATSCSDCD